LCCAFPPAREGLILALLTTGGAAACGGEEEGKTVATQSNPNDLVEQIRTVRQARLYRPDPVPEDVVSRLLEVARWTGSSRNTQPWHFIVITDKELLRQISRIRPPINWVADVPLAIGIVLDGASEVSEAYDEGRVTERLLIAAHALGLGGGTAWFGDESQQAEGKRILGIPPERTARSLVAIGYPTTTKDHRPNANIPGRKPLAELVSYERFGRSRA
jgi:nitroreductase